jgi:signal transduction histidine kinase
MKFTFFQNLSLQKKFTLITSFAVIILMIIIGVMITRRERNIMYRDLERQARVLAEALAIPVMSDLSKNVLYARLGLIEEGKIIGSYFSEIFKKKDMDFVCLVVLNEIGKVIAHNDINEYGKVYQDPVTVNALFSNTTIVQQYYDKTISHEALDVATPLLLGKKRWGTLKFAISLKKVDQEIQTTIISTIIFTLLLLIGGFCIIIILSRRFIEPVTQLAQTMESAGGDMLNVKADIKGQNEIAFLGQSFNRMIDRIQESNLKLKQTHEKLLQFARTMERAGEDMLNVKADIKGQDEIAFLGQRFNKMIDRIRESNLELKQTHEKLLQSEKHASLGILASGVAHEINNPLGGIFNCVHMLEQKDDNDDYRKRYLKLIKDGLSRIEETVQKLLWMSRIEGKNPRVVGIKQSLKDIYGLIEYKMKESNITYSERVEDGLSVVIDPHDLEQVMINLMINAVQSMKNGGLLGIHAYRNNSEVILKVSDTGEGIVEKNLQHLFDPFYTTKQPGEGTGLGLWLTYEIVNNYHGDISVQSTRGKGTTFTVTFKRV